MKTTQDSQANIITKAIYDISKAIVDRLELKELLNETVSTLAKILHADACSVFLVDNDLKLRIKAGEGYFKNLIGVAEYDLGEGLTGTIAKKGQSIRTRGRDKITQIPDWKGKYDSTLWPGGRRGCVSFFGVPLKVKGKTIGVLR